MALSYLEGVQSPELWELTLPQLIEQQASRFGDHDAAVFPWQDVRVSYNDLRSRSERTAKAMLALGLKHGDGVGIMAGNRVEYIETFLGAGRIGCPFAVFNNTYSPNELKAAVKVAGCKLLFIPFKIGVKHLAPHIEALISSEADLPELNTIVMLSDELPMQKSRIKLLTYSSFLPKAQASNSDALRSAENGLKVNDCLNLQFTSGTTGAPKAAMLTHRNLINNGYLTGCSMGLTPEDILCCPPPLFHCFGLVCGFLSAITNGSSIVFPNDQFDPLLTVDALYNEKCTALLGVPTMMIAALSANYERKHKITTVRTGLAGGSAVPVSVMKQLDKDFGCQRMCIIYGMTETSPVTFMTTVNDSQEKREKTVGAIMPHTRAKVVDREGKIVPRGTPGEICTSGYALQLGYYKNEAKTAEAMKTDENGIRWMYTGDQGLIDEDGYCVITGRIKDMIIRGGENIYPAEIEERMIEHPAIVEASVVGIKDEHYGEVVGAFLKIRNPNDSRPDLDEIRAFIKETKGSHKAPQHVFWIGDPGVGDDFPKTGSGKHQKHILRAISEKLLAKSQPKARL